MSIEVTSDDAVTHIKLDKVFDYTIVNAFFDIIRGVPDQNRQIIIDCENVRHHDSAAIGMVLFVCNSHPTKDIAIQNCHDELHRMLYIARIYEKCSVNKDLMFVEEEVAA